MSTDHESVDYDAVGFVVSSDYRLAVIEALADGPMIPSKLAREAETQASHISRALNDLRDEDLVELLVDEERRKGRVYGLTEDGQRLAQDPEGILGIGGTA